MPTLHQYHTQIIKTLHKCQLTLKNHGKTNTKQMTSDERYFALQTATNS